MSASSKSRSGIPPFVAAKTSGRRIPVDSAMALQALVQTSLDPAVVEIDFIESAKVSGIEVPVRSIVLVRSDGPWLLDLVDAEPPQDIDQAGVRLLAIESLGIPMLTQTHADLDKEPRASNCDLVWACRRRQVAPDDRIRILNRLEESPVSSLIEVASAVRTGDGVASVFALACENLVELDLASAPVGPSTAVALGKRRDAVTQSSI
jgi:hypothetical protein